MCKGKKLTISATGEASKAIEEGSLISVTAKLGPIQLISRTYNLCEVVPEYGITCPLPAGRQTLGVSVDLPGSIPRFTYFIRAEARTGDGAGIFCIEGSLKVTSFGVGEPDEENEEWPYQKKEISLPQEISVYKKGGASEMDIDDDEKEEQEIDDEEEQQEEEQQEEQQQQQQQQQQGYRSIMHKVSNDNEQDQKEEQQEQQDQKHEKGSSLVHLSRELQRELI